MYESKIEEVDGEQLVKIPDELFEQMGWNEYTILSVVLEDGNIKVEQKTEWTYDQLLENDNFEKVLEDVKNNKTVHTLLYKGKLSVIRPVDEDLNTNQKDCGFVDPPLFYDPGTSKHASFVNALKEGKDVFFRNSFDPSEKLILNLNHPKINGNPYNITNFGYNDLLILDKSIAEKNFDTVYLALDENKTIYYKDKCSNMSALVKNKMFLFPASYCIIVDDAWERVKGTKF